MALCLETFFSSMPINASNDFNKLLEIEPNDAWALRARGEVYRLLHNYDNALEDFDRSLEIEPNHAWALSRRGDVYYSLDRYDESLRDFNISLKIEPNQIWALNKRGHLYYWLERHEDALIDLTKSLETESNNAFVLRIRGAIYFNSKQHHNNTTVSIDPDDAWTLSRRREVYYALGRFFSAINDLDRSLEIDPNDAFAWSSGEKFIVHLTISRDRT